MPPLATLALPELIAVIGGTVGAGAGLAQTGMSIANAVGGDSGSGPDPMVAAKQAQDASDKARLRGVVGRSTADAQTRTSGGASPEFLANVATQDAGTPDMQGQALDMVKQLMSGGGG